MSFHLLLRQKIVLISTMSKLDHIDMVEIVLYGEILFLN